MVMATLGYMDMDEAGGTPAILKEFVDAVQAYIVARDEGDKTDEIEQRIREAWLPLREDMSYVPSKFALELVEKIFHTTH
jgi:hypothetical protein